VAIFAPPLFFFGYDFSAMFGSTGDFMVKGHGDVSLASVGIALLSNLAE